MTPRIRAIETEYGEPILDVLRGYAAMGYSRSDVAGILGYSRPHFTRHVLPAVDPGQRIVWPGRVRSNAVREGIARRSSNLDWIAAVRRSARSPEGRRRRRATALQRWHGEAA